MNNPAFGATWSPNAFFQLPMLSARRRNRAVWLSLLLWLMSGLLPMAEAQTRRRPPANAARTDRLIVKPKRDAKTATTDLVAGASVLRRFKSLDDLQVLRLPSGLSPDAALELLKKGGHIDYAEKDYYVTLQSTEPNDFRYYTQELWNLHNTGYLGGTPGADIKAPEAWDIRHDAPNIVVALVDSGVRQTHEDLAPNLWRNPREIPGNGIDDDANGVVDDVHGLNAYLDNGNPEDDLGHGTHVAGTIGAVGNNSVGVVGVAWKVQIMPTKFTDPQGNGSISDAIACIDYARKNGAHVINASWGATTLFDSSALRDAIAAARDAGIIFVTIAGNDHGADNDAVPYYPGAFDLDNIVVATATDRNDQLAFFANHGKRTVDLGAPGYNVFSTWFGSDADYQYYNGGSMAVAHVSGAAALVRAQFPGDDYRTIIKRILDGTDPLPTLQNKTVTGGRLNLFKALGGAAPLPSVTIAATDAAAAESGRDEAVFTLTRNGALVAPLPVTYLISGTASNGADYDLLSGTVVIPTGQAAVTITVRPVDDSSVEGAESVTVTLAANNTYATGTLPSASATIADNDREPTPLPQPPTISVVATDGDAAEAGPASGTFTITRTGDISGPLPVKLALSGTATQGVDYQTISGSVTLAAGASSATVTVSPNDDPTVESDETVILTLEADAAYVLGTGVSAVVVIDDNDAPPSNQPTVTVHAVVPFTIELGLVDGIFEVRRSGSTEKALTVRLAVSGTATNGGDYKRLGSTVTIPVGKKSARLLVEPIRDRVVEKTETIILTLSPESGYKIGAGSSATIQLFDDDLLWAFLARLKGGG